MRPLEAKVFHLGHQNREYLDDALLEDLRSSRRVLAIPLR